MYRGHCRSSAYSKDALAKPRMEASVLYMAMATPAQAQSLESHTSPCKDRAILQTDPKWAVLLLDLSRLNGRHWRPH